VPPPKSPLLAKDARNGAPWVRLAVWENTLETVGSRQGAGVPAPQNSSRTSGFAVDFGPPPADADEEEAPVVEEFGRLAFKSVADELEDPSDHEQAQRVGPQAMEEDAGEKNGDRNHNCRYAEGVADAIDGVLVAAGVLRDPLLTGAIA
jgi:hypothetical protein